MIGCDFFLLEVKMKPVAYREELLHNFKKNETLNFLKIAFSFSVEQERSENSES